MSRFVRALALAGALILGCSPVLAQQFPSGYIEGNAAATAAPPRAIAPTSWLDRWCGSTQWLVPVRGASAWECVGNSGTGNVVFSTSPTLVTPDLGTPTVLTLTNATGLPVSTGISGLASGIASWLATSSSANLATALTDETGTGALVFGTSPTLVTPGIRSSGAGFDIRLAATEVLTADRTLTYVLGDAARTVTLSGNLTINSGTAITAGSTGTWPIWSAGTLSGSSSATRANAAAPSAPSAGNVTIWADSTDLRFHDKNAAGVIGTTVVADAGTTNNFLTAISAAGAISKAQPSCSNLSDATVLCSLTPGNDVATFLGTASSANLAAAVTGETGTGALVFGTSPTLETPILGTPTSATLTNATGLPIATGVSGLGTGVATALATPSSANLAAALTDETGSGAAVFAVSPALTGTPTAPTAAGSDNSTKIATTAYVDAQVAGGVSGVGSFNSRTGVVVPVAGDYTYAADTIALPRSYLAGLELSNNGSDATNDIDIAAGAARDGSNAANIILSSALTKRSDATWAVGSGNGGLDDGTIADGTIHHYAIKRSDTGVVDVLQSLSPERSGTVTITIASPAVVTWADHGLQVGSRFIPTTTGALPTGLTAGTAYYVISAGFAVGSFRVSATQGGSAINTTGSQSGVHTGTSAPLMPTNYDYRRRLGSWPRVSSALKTMTQKGDVFLYDSVVTDRSSTSAFAFALYAISTPVGVKTQPLLHMYQKQAAGAGTVQSVAYDALRTDSPGCDIMSFFASDGASGTSSGGIFTNYSAQIQYIVVFTGSPTLSGNALKTRGWIDRRGRDD